MTEKKQKPLAVSHMLMFFVIPCLGFIVWASWGLIGSLLEEKPEDIPSRIAAVEEARSSGDRWQAVYALSQELQKMRNNGEWEKSVSDAQKREMFLSLVSLQAEHAADFRFKKYVLLTLGQFGGSDLLPHVQKELQSQDDEIRFFAAWSFLELLGRAEELTKAEYLPVVSAWLKSEEAAFRKIAATFLVQHKEPMPYAEVRPLLEDEDLEVRWNTAVALASVGDEEAIPVLKDMFSLQSIRKMDLRSLEDLKQLLASAHEAAEKLGSEEVFEAREALLGAVNPDTPEGRAVFEAMGR